MHLLVGALVIAENTDNMSKKRLIIWAGCLFVACGLIFLHAVHWHVSGTYQEMSNWEGTDKAYIAGLYNLGLMLALGIILSQLLERLYSLFSDRTGKLES